MRKVILYDNWIGINIVKNKIFESLGIGSNIFVVRNNGCIICFGGILLKGLILEVILVVVFWFFY